MPMWYQTVRSSLLLVQSVTGMLIFWYSLNRRRHFKQRLALSMLVGMAVCLGVQTQFYVPGDSAAAFLGRELMSVVNTLALLCVAFCIFDESPWTIIMAACTGFVAQDIGGTVKTVLRLCPWLDAISLHPVGILAVDLLCYGGTFALLFVLFRPYTRAYTDSEHERKVKMMISLGVLLLRLTLVRIIHDSVPENLLHALAFNLYHLLVGVLLLMVQFGVLERSRLTQQVEVMRELMHQQYVQYEDSKAAVELIHEKYHDLKQMLSTLQGIVPEQQLTELRTAIERYDSRVRSGYEVLDVLLTQKMDLCIQRGIDLTVNLGSADFSFMDEMDLYTLFHNALNNAIHAVSELPQSVFRYILLLVRQEGNMVTIHVENPCGEDVRFENGLPQTQSDTRYHGFGMKSMERTAEKYDGTLAVRMEDGRFYLDLLLVQPRRRR